MEKLSEYILKKAIEADICEDWAGKISAATQRGQLLEMYVAGIDFCLSKNFPSNEDLVRLGDDELRGYGIYVDRECIRNDADFIVLLGGSVGTIAVTGHTVCQLFVKHNSQATIAVNDNAFTVIDCFDNASVTVSASDNSKVLINVYGQAQVKHEANGNAYIKVIQKNKASY